MARAGFTHSLSAETSDIILINTCGFIADAKRESIEVIMDSSLLNEGGGNRKKVAVLGCLSQRYISEMSNDLPEADFVYGLFDEKFIHEMCARFGILTSDIPSSGRIPLIQGLPYSYIKISEGCSNNCSYCAIPLIRGPRVSFAPEEIIRDAREAVSLGAKELIIVAQDTGGYSWGDADIRLIINSLSEINGVDWIRLMYCHPDHLTDRLIDTIASNEKIVKYLDIPFQHANREILSSMNRAGDAVAYLALLERVRSRVPGIKIRSTFMVGYPGETDDQFNELLSFAERARIDRGGAFIFSPEEGTPAALMKNMVSDKIKQARHDELMELLSGISLENLESMNGSIVRVLVEEKLADGQWAGRTEFDAPDVDGIFFLTSDSADINSIIKARVTGSAEYDLYGEMI